MSGHANSEGTLIEEPAIAIFQDLHWNTIGAFDEVFGEGGTLGREHGGEVILSRHLLPALRKLNPQAPAEAIGRFRVIELPKDCIQR